MGTRERLVTLRKFESFHRDLLAQWLREPHVARWYPEPEANLAWATHPPPGGAQAIIAAGPLNVGYLRWQRVDRETLDNLGLHEIPAHAVDADILISQAGGIGRGLGPSALNALAAELRRDPTVPMIGLTTELENTLAHRAFEKAGYRIARQYEVPKLGLCHLMLLDLRSETTLPVPFEIRLDDLSGPEVAGLLEEHLAFVALHSPPESVHALDLAGLRARELTLWSVWQGTELVGCGALKELDPQHGELKSMRTASSHLRRGAAAAMLEHLIEVAQQRGYRRVSLETGSAQAFAPARALYARFGFEPCGPFADYVEDPYSVFMTRELRA